MTTPRTETPGRASAWPFVGMALLACSFFLYAASGLLAPGWAVVSLLLLWLVLFVLACRWWSRRPRGVAGVGLLSILLWFALVNAGGAWLGWTA